MFDEKELKELAEKCRYVSVEVFEPVFNEWRRANEPAYKFNVLSKAQDDLYNAYKSLMELVNL